MHQRCAEALHVPVSIDEARQDGSSAKIDHLGRPVPLLDLLTGTHGNDGPPVDRDGLDVGVPIVHRVDNPVYQDERNPPRTILKNQHENHSHQDST
jgi:hypothetical protein